MFSNLLLSIRNPAQEYARPGEENARPGEEYEPNGEEYTQQRHYDEF